MSVPTTLINQGRDQNGYIVNWYNEMPFSNTVYTNILVQNVGQPVTVPDGVNLVVFNWSEGKNLIIGNGLSTGKFLLLEDADKILLEDGDSILLEGTGSFVSGFALNPKVKTVIPGQILNLVSPDADCLVCLEFFNRQRQYS
jgi:hypothetical protein